MMMRMILRFSTKNLTTCHGKNLRQNRVAPVGEGGKVISFGPGVMFLSCMVFLIWMDIFEGAVILITRKNYSGMRNQNGRALALYKKR
jgi:hypothetical protein